MAGRRRGFETVGDMVRSLGLVLIAVVVLVLITLRPNGKEIRTVDYRPTLAQARVGAPYALVAPDGLQGQWRATSAYFDPPARSGVPGVTAWHVGFVTPAGAYAAFEQANGSPGDLLRSVLDQPQQEAATSGSGAWQRWTDSSGGRRALVRTTGAVTVVVDGSASWAELEQLATALRAEAPLPS